MIDRNQYHENENYRKGYDDGVEDGKSQIIFKMETMLNTLINEFNLLKKRDN